MFERLLFHKHLQDDEVIVAVAHKHWLLGIKHLFWPTASFLLSWLLLYAAPTQGVFVIVAGWSVLSLVWWMRNFFDFYLDAWIVTNQGIIDLEWHGWFHRQSSRILYSDVHGVSDEVNGIAGTLLGYGTISIEKISTGGAVSLSQAAHPRRIGALILENMETYLHHKNLKNAKHVEEIIAGFVAEKIQMESLKPKAAPIPTEAASPKRRSFSSKKI